MFVSLGISVVSVEIGSSDHESDMVIEVLHSSLGRCVSKSICRERGVSRSVRQRRGHGRGRAH